MLIKIYFATLNSYRICHIILRFTKQVQRSFINCIPGKLCNTFLLHVFQTLHYMTSVRFLLSCDEIYKQKNTHLNMKLTLLGNYASHVSLCYTWHIVMTSYITLVKSVRTMLCSFCHASDCGSVCNSKNTILSVGS